MHKKFIDGDVEGSVLLGLLGRRPPESAPCGSLIATLTLREGSGPIVNIVCRNISCLEELLDFGGSPPTASYGMHSSPDRRRATGVDLATPALTRLLELGPPISVRIA